MAAHNAALEAAHLQAKVCLSGCPSCVKVKASAPDKPLGGKITAQAISVRSQCESNPANLVRPPKNIDSYESCSLWRRKLVAASACAWPERSRVGT